jgi:hypothetical protein
MPARLFMIFEIPFHRILAMAVWVMTLTSVPGALAQAPVRRVTVPAEPMCANCQLRIDTVAAIRSPASTSRLREPLDVHIVDLGRNRILSTHPVPQIPIFMTAGSNIAFWKDFSPDGEITAVTIARFSFLTNGSR